MNTKTNLALDFSDKEYREDFTKLKSYLEQYNFKHIISDQDFNKNLKRFHKKLRAYYILANEIQHIKKSFYIKENVADLISIIPLLPQGLYKQIRLTHRSAIENFFKYLFVNFIETSENSNIKNKVSKLIESVLLFYKEKDIIKQEIDKLTCTYSLLCEYAHTTSEQHGSMVSLLIDIPKIDSSELDSCIDELIASTVSMLKILIYIHENTYKQMSSIKREDMLNALSPSLKQNINMNVYS